MEFMQDPECDPQTILDTMEGLQDEIESKLDSYVTVRKDLEAQQDKLKKEIDRLQKNADSLKANIDRINIALMSTMELTGKKKLQTEHYNLLIKKNGGVAPLKITGDVPAEFCKMVPNNDMIRQALKAGALDFAELGERGVHLSVR